MDHNQALFKVLLLDILPSLLDVTTDLAQAISLMVPQVCPMIIVIKSILMEVIIVQEDGREKDELRMFGLIVLALAWAPGLLVLVMILCIKIGFWFQIETSNPFRSVLVKIHSGASVSSSQAQ